MNELFQTKDNPIAYIILEYMKEYGGDFDLKQTRDFLGKEIQDFLVYYLENKRVVEKYLKYRFITKNNCDSVEVEGGNLITALWFSGIFPENEDIVEESGEYYLEGVIYSFDKNKFKLNKRDANKTSH